MNNDQLKSLLRTFLKFVGGILLAHGATKSATWLNAEDTVGLLMAIYGWIMSHQTHKDEPVSSAPTANKLPVWIFLPLLALAWLVGCAGTSAIKTAAVVETTTDAAVVSTMTGWDFYVAEKHPGTNAELQVLHAFKVVQAAEITVVDATLVLAKDPTNTAPLAAATDVFNASRANLITVISSITNAIH